MAKDLLIIDRDQKIIKHFPIGHDDHYRLVDAARSYGDCHLISRLEDYYSDTEFSADEIQLLIVEIRGLQRFAEKTQLDLLNLLLGFERIAEHAKNLKLPLIAVAD